MITEKQKLQLEIEKKLIESGLNVRDQINLLNDIHDKLELIRYTALKAKQKKLKL